MSTATARVVSSRTAGGSLPLRAPSGPPAAPRRSGSLRLVPPRPSRAPKAPFVGVVVALLAVGLLGLLLLNTVLAQDAFHLHALEGQAKTLEDREQLLAGEVEALQAPAALAEAAKDQGMVPGGPPVFLRLSDGKVLGRSSPAPSAPAPAVAAIEHGSREAAPSPETGVASPAPTPSSRASAAPSAKASAQPSAQPSAKPSPKPSATPSAKASASPSASASRRAPSASPSGTSR